MGQNRKSRQTRVATPWGWLRLLPVANSQLPFKNEIRLASARGVLSRCQTGPKSYFQLGDPRRRVLGRAGWEYSRHMVQKKFEDFALRLRENDNVAVIKRPFKADT